MEIVNSLKMELHLKIKKIIIIKKITEKNLKIRMELKNIEFKR